MSKFSCRLTALVLAASIVGTACGVNESGAAQALAAPSSTTPADVDGETSSPDSVDVEVLAFQDVERAEGQQLWNHVNSVSVSSRFEFALDPTLALDGGFTTGQGLTVRWSDPFNDDDVLVMIREDRAFRAYRVGNEVFIDELVGEQQGLFFAELLAEVLRPLETGALDGTSVLSESNPIGQPDIVYSLPSDEVEGQITGGDLVTVDVINQGPDVNYLIPDRATMLTRQEVGTFENEILRTWYLDQAG